jgi:hypothetical protein
MLDETNILDLDFLEHVENATDVPTRHIRIMASWIKRLQKRCAELENVRELADYLVFEVGAVGEINSRHPRVIALLDALYATDPETRIMMDEEKSQ